MKQVTIIMMLLILSFSGYANDVSAILEAQSLSQRAVTLAKLLHQSGKSCGTVTRTFLQGFDKEDAAYWNAACSNGQSYNVKVPANPSAKTRILECEILKIIGTECFTKLQN